MGNLTLSEFRDELRFELDNTTTDEVAGSSLTRWINQAYLHVCQPHLYLHRELQVEVLVPMATDTVQYTLDTSVGGYTVNRFVPTGNPGGLASVPAAVTSVYHVRDTTVAVSALRKKLQPVEVQQIDEDQLLTQGQPYYYAVWRQQLYIDKRPTSVENGQLLVVRAYMLPAQLSADTDETTVAAAWDNVILAGAAWLGFRKLGDRDAAAEYRLEFGRLFRDVSDWQQVEMMDRLAGFTAHVPDSMPRS